MDLTNDEEAALEKPKDIVTTNDHALLEKPKDLEDAENTEPELMEDGDEEAVSSMSVKVVEAMIHTSSNQESLDSSRSSLSPPIQDNPQEYMEVEDLEDPDAINIINVESEEEDESAQL